jgi:hypothetical protein
MIIITYYFIIIIIQVFLRFFFLGYFLFENWLSSNQKTKSWCQQNTNKVGPIKHILIIHPSIHPSMLTNKTKKALKEVPSVASKMLLGKSL